MPFQRTDRRQFLKIAAMTGLAVAARPGLGREHVADRLQRLLRFALLEESEQGVDQDHPEDDPGVDPEPEHQFGEARAQQDIDQDVVELGEEAHERPAPLAGRKPVGSMLGEAPGSLRGIESRGRIGRQPVLV